MRYYSSRTWIRLCQVHLLARAPPSCGGAPHLRGRPLLARAPPSCEGAPLLRGRPPLARAPPSCEGAPFLRGRPTLARAPHSCEGARGSASACRDRQRCRSRQADTDPGAALATQNQPQTKHFFERGKFYFAPSRCRRMENKTFLKGGSSDSQNKVLISSPSFMYLGENDRVPPN